MKIFRTAVALLGASLVVLPSAMAQTRAGAPAGHPGVPFPTKATPQAIDRGRLSAQPGQESISVTVALSLRRLDEAEALAKSISTPGSANYHHFLTADEFVSRFGPTNADVARVVAGLAKYGLSVQRTTATTLKVTGSPAAMERAFTVNLHSYEVPAHGRSSAYSYHAPLNHLSLPSEIAGSVAGVVGLDSRPSFRPLHIAAPQAVANGRPAKPAATPSSTTNPPGLLTVADFAQQYDVQPLYNKGITGKGRTIGIMTLASFAPSDAYDYWGYVGLTVDPNRITVVDVDGGPGAPSDDSGSDETTLDVEQSGGIAPGANIIVYQAPNTNEGFVDVFAAAIEANIAQSLSISWGSWEWYDNLDNSPVTDPFTGKTVATTQAVHELLLRAALQGQSTFAASGDAGAYDLNRGCLPKDTYYSCDLALSVDYPSSDSLITAAGGTTLPGLQEYCQNAACSPPYYDINIPAERVWGWDYLTGLCATVYGADPIDCGIFPAGGGGGVSITFGVPLYQLLIPGVQRSQSGQNFVYDGTLYYTLPAHFPGRNVPDVSFNADPETGYIIIYTSQPANVEYIYSFFGGTSFVAPQLNGVTALLGQSTHGRLGLLNYPLYLLALTGQAYRGAHAPLNVISAGNNWFYQGRNGYSPAAGLGTIDVANLAKVFAKPF